MMESIKSGFVNLLFIIFLVAMCLLLLKGCQLAVGFLGSGGEEEKAKPTVVVDGQNGYLIQNTFIAVDKGSLKELVSYYVADNGEAILRMADNGRIFGGLKGEKVTVIDSGFTQSYIEIVSTGMRGYVESELVRSRIEE
ncbi:hypothetical protein [Sporosarcina sp. E16_8]|uniref:hypothetical protein n=1 Tax=Sporosarcina sp. E16_8 TaxID=2789295 RepID=UPI001A92A58F|nr:hypothetical protein [Sporosarcina sp. E16_8]MBO0587444.1 hypothetical protein [Sporosarcina sp. E16_8]